MTVYIPDSWNNTWKSANLITIVVNHIHVSFTFIFLVLANTTAIIKEHTRLKKIISTVKAMG
jgi:hypothetical protein